MSLLNKKFALILLPICAVYLPSFAFAEACKETGSPEEASLSTNARLPEKIVSIACAIKHVFRSRVRYHKNVEPVDMTVGSPPMVSDDTGTPGNRRFEINLTTSGDFAGDTHRIESPLLDVNYGIGDLTQLKFEVPYVLLASQDDKAVEPRSVAHAHGVGDATVGIKYRFYDNKETGQSLALYPQIRFRTPGANKAVSEEKTVVILPLLMTREFEKASLTANIGVAHADYSRLFASIGAGTRLSDQWAVLGEIAGNNLNARDDRQILLNLGIRRKLSEKRLIAASIGHDIHVGGDKPLHRYFSISFQQMLGE